MNSGLSSGPHGGDDSTDREKNALYVSFKLKWFIVHQSFIFHYFTAVSCFN